MPGCADGCACCSSSSGSEGGRPSGSCGHAVWTAFLPPGSPLAVAATPGPAVSRPSSSLCPTGTSTPWAFRGSPGEPQLSEPPWYGPVCPVVWEGCRAALRAAPYPDLPRQRRKMDRSGVSVLALRSAAPASAAARGAHATPMERASRAEDPPPARPAPSQREAKPCGERSGGGLEKARDVVPAAPPGPSGGGGLPSSLGFASLLTGAAGRARAAPGPRTPCCDRSA